MLLQPPLGAVDLTKARRRHQISVSLQPPHTFGAADLAKARRRHWISVSLQPPQTFGAVDLTKARGRHQISVLLQPPQTFGAVDLTKARGRHRILVSLQPPQNSWSGRFGLGLTGDTGFRCRSDQLQLFLFSAIQRNASNFTRTTTAFVLDCCIISIILSILPRLLFFPELAITNLVYCFLLFRTSEAGHLTRITFALRLRKMVRCWASGVRA